MCIYSFVQLYPGVNTCIYDTYEKTENEFDG